MFNFSLLKGIVLNIFFLSAFAPCSYTQSAYSYQFSGTLKGLGNDTLVLVFPDPLAKDNIDEIKFVGNQDFVSIIGKATDPKVGIAIIRSAGYKKRDVEGFKFFIEKGHIRISGDVNDFSNTIVSGTPSNEDFFSSQQHTKYLYGIRDSLWKRYGSIQDKSNTEAKRLQAEAVSMGDSVFSFFKQEAKTKSHLLSSAMYVYLLADKVPVNELELLYDNLDDNVKQLKLISIIPQRIEAKRRSVVGALAPLFEQKDINGQLVRMKDFKGKYVLIDFWASWCGPCRAEYPYLKKAYEKFKTNDFEIIGISCDDSEAKWLKAIKDDGLEWIQLIEPSISSRDIFNLYGVRPIPDNFLVDPTGMIIARGLRGDDLEAELNKILKK